MKCIIGWLMIIAATQALFADTHYVSLDGTNDSAHGYTNWAGAATNIQRAVSAAVASDTVLVSNGTYYLTNMLTIAVNPLTLRSVNGRDVTILDGQHSNRVLSSSYLFMDGFTIQNGYSIDRPGGVDLRSGTMTNCIVRWNYTASTGSVWNTFYSENSPQIANCDIYHNTNTRTATIMLGGPTGIMWNCNIVSNNSGKEAITVRSVGSVLSNCLVQWNLGTNGNGGVATIANEKVLVTHCTISYNSGMVGAGGFDLLRGESLLANSIFVSNYSGGGSYAAVNVRGSDIRSCLIYGSSSNGLYVNDGGETGFVDNCTVVSNWGGGITFDGATSNKMQVRNMVVWGHIADVTGTASGTNYCYYCRAGTGNILPPSQGNITNYPAFVDPGAGNWRLNNGSPCINAGINQVWMNGALDLDGRPRLDRFSGQVDMGAYEHLPHGTMVRVH